MSDDRDIDGFFTTARVTARDEAVELSSAGFEEFAYPLDSEELAPWRDMTYEKFAASRRSNEFLSDLLHYWDELYSEPYLGITTDGTVRQGLYPLAPGGLNDEEPIAAAQAFLASLYEDQRRLVSYPMGAHDWRGWSNPEFVFHRNGLRLENLSDVQAQAFLDLMAASLSAEGDARVREAMELNGYLGELTGLVNVMNNRSFWVAIFGDPSIGEPWGWQLSGHHVCINFVTVAGREVIAPAFIGGEPALAPSHPPLFLAREQLALGLASSFTPAQRAKAVVYESVLDPAMPEGRLHPADERHVGGAFRDNRVVALEGIPVMEFDEVQRAVVREIVEDFHLLLRPAQRAQTMAEFDAHVDETWFSWYGATDGTQPIYFRIQSPVILAELDNHAGVWLANKLPARFHVHTCLRLPNGNDYGKAYLASGA